MNVNHVPRVRLVQRELLVAPLAPLVPPEDMWSVFALPLLKRSVGTVWPVQPQWESPPQLATLAPAKASTLTPTVPQCARLPLPAESPQLITQALNFARRTHSPLEQPTSARPALPTATLKPALPLVSGV